MYTLDAIAGVTGGVLTSAPRTRGQAEPAGVSIDTRRLRPGDLFFALRGPDRDGHAFVGEALSRGASAAVVSDAWYASTPDRPDGPLLRVADPEAALRTLAAHYRRSLSVRVVAVTGSNGKTTTKEMAAAILSRRYRTAKTEGNLNNHLGVPLTLLAIPRDAEVAVVEMGMNHPGELKRLAELARPEVGVVTNVGESHLEFLGSVERVLAAKGELLESLEPDGTAVINADDPHLMSGRLRIRARTLTFGIDRPADVRAVDVEPVGEGGARFTLAGRRVALGVFGREFVYDALAAAAAAHALGIPLEDAGPAIEGFRPFRMRMEVIRAGGVTVINDAYNANPLSVRAALDTLGRLGARGRTVAVLGDMLELGAETRRLHQEVGRHAARSGVGRLLTVGAAAREIGSGALAAGMAHRNSRHFEGSGEVREALRRMVEAGEIADGDVVLVKASRGLKMETVVEDLVEVLRGRE